MNLKEFLLTTLFPYRCLQCKAVPLHQKDTLALCASCLKAITIHETLSCIRCRARLAENTRTCHSNSPLRLASVGRYNETPLQLLVTHLKYRRQTSLITTLSVLISQYLTKLDYNWSDYQIIPIPLHPKKERQRGFNQSLLIAEVVAAQLNLPLLKNVLHKTKPTLPQAGTHHRAERIRNLKDCFTVTQPNTLMGKKILLIDDVCTTGTTLIEAANTLKQCGAQQIIGLVIARTD